jgi:hypothetical protein
VIIILNLLVIYIIIGYFVGVAFLITCDSKQFREPLNLKRFFVETLISCSLIFIWLPVAIKMLIRWRKER